MNDLKWEDAHTLNVGYMIIDQGKHESISLRGVGISVEGAEKLSKVFVGKTNCTALDLGECDLLNDSSKVIIERLGSQDCRLKHIKLDQNDITDEGLVGINIVLETNVFLEFLDLSKNKITKVGAVLLAKGLFNNSTLKWLDLSNNEEIGDTGGKNIFAALQNNSGLKTLLMNKCSLKSKTFTKLAKLIQKNESVLETLSIAQNELDGILAVVVAEGLKNNKHLKSLNISVSAKLGHFGAVAIIDSLSTNTVLKTLALSGNQIGSDRCKEIAASLIQNNTLEVFKFANTGIGNIGSIMIIDSVLNMPKLIFLDLSYNQLEPSSCEHLEILLKSEDCILKHLDISNNEIHDRGIRLIADGLQLNTSLEEINVSLNGIGVSGGIALAESLSNNTCLKIIDLRDNQISGQAVLAFVTLLDHNKTLTKILLSNKFAKTIEKKLLKNQAEKREIAKGAILSAIAKLHKVQWNRAKLMIVGEEGAGKTALLKSLLGERYKKGDKTKSKTGFATLPSVLVKSIKNRSEWVVNEKPSGLEDIILRAGADQMKSGVDGKVVSEIHKRRSKIYLKAVPTPLPTEEESIEKVTNETENIESSRTEDTKTDSNRSNKIEPVKSIPVKRVQNTKKVEQEAPEPAVNDDKNDVDESETDEESVIFLEVEEKKKSPERSLRERLEVAAKGLDRAKSSVDFTAILKNIRFTKFDIVDAQDEVINSETDEIKVETKIKKDKREPLEKIKKKKPKNLRISNVRYVMGSEQLDQRISTARLVKQVYNGNEDEEKAPLNLLIWVSSGGSSFRTLQHLFLNRGGVFLAVFNCAKAYKEIFAYRKKKKEDPNCVPIFDSIDQLNWWLKMIKLHAKSSPVIIVGTHSGLIKKEKQFKIINKLLKQLSPIKLCDIKVQPNVKDNLLFFPVENNYDMKTLLRKQLKRDNLAGLPKVVENTVRALKSVKKQVPVRWIKCLDEIFKDDENHFLTYDEVKELANNCGVKEETEIIEMLKLFNQLGAIYYFSGSQNLSAFVTLNPQWLVDNIAQIMPDKARSGTLRILDKEQENKLMQDLKDSFLLTDYEYFTEKHIFSKKLATYLWGVEAADFMLDFLERTMVISKWNFPVNINRIGQPKGKVTEANLSVLFGDGGSFSEPQQKKSTYYIVPSGPLFLSAEKEYNDVETKVFFDFSDTFLPESAFERLVSFAVAHASNLVKVKGSVVKAPEFSKHLCVLSFGKNLEFSLQFEEEMQRIVFSVQSTNINPAKCLSIIIALLYKINLDVMSQSLNWDFKFWKKGMKTKLSLKEVKEDPNFKQLLFNDEIEVKFEAENYENKSADYYMFLEFL